MNAVKTAVIRDELDTWGDDLALAELAARSGLEPELAAWYESDPDGACAAYGIARGGDGEQGRVLAVATAGSAPLTVEDLDRADGADSYWCSLCICTVAGACSRS